MYIHYSLAPLLSINPVLVNEGNNLMACVLYDTAPPVATSIVLSTQDGAAQG